jgi:mRNA interferase MazF
LVTLTLAVPEEIAQAAKQVAQRTGSSPETVLIQALRAHFPPVSTELQAELDAWNAASDEDLARFERGLE